MIKRTNLNSPSLMDFKSLFRLSLVFMALRINQSEGLQGNQTFYFAPFIALNESCNSMSHS